MPKVIFACQVCGRRFTTEPEAVVCETQPEEKALCKVGDIVTARQGFGWFDGDKNWVSNWNEKLKDLSFYYVVTAIDRDDQNGHRIRYHLATKAMTDGTGYHLGYTFASGHFRPRKIVKPPKFIVDDSKNMIGSRAENLL